MAVGRFSAAARSGSKWTTERARPSGLADVRADPALPATGPVTARSTVAVGTPPAIVYSGRRGT